MHQRLPDGELHPVEERRALRSGLGALRADRSGGARVGVELRRCVCLDVRDGVAGRPPLEPRRGADDGGVGGERDVEVSVFGFVSTPA